MEEQTIDTLQAPARPAGEEPAASPEVSSSAEEWKQVHKLAQRHLNRLVSLEAKVLKGDDPEAVHDMRVTSRRLQQVLVLMFPDPLPRQARRLRRKIRACRRALGELRNCDVLIGHVAGRLARKRCAKREVWTAVKQYLEEGRTASFARAARKLCKLNLAGFYLRAKQVLDQLRSAEAGGPGSQAAVQPDRVAQGLFRGRLAEALLGAWSAFDKQLATARREKTVPSLHSARICAKRLRYLLEVADRFEIPGSTEALAGLKKIQERLGNWHDSEVLEEMMVDMIATPEFVRDQLPLALAVGKLILRNRLAKQKLRGRPFQMTLDSAPHQAVKKWAEGLLAARGAGT